MDIPPELWARLERLRSAAVLAQSVGDIFLDRLFPGEPVWLACDLLVAGIESPAVIELACESPTLLTMREGEPLVRRLLSDLAVAPMDIRRAGWIAARDLAREIEAGTLDAEHGAHLLLGLQHACHSPEEMNELLPTLDDWERTPPPNRNPTRFNTTIQNIARAIIQAAPANVHQRNAAGGGISSPIFP